MPCCFPTYHVTPSIGNKDVIDVGGAYINCYVDSVSINEAKDVAEHKLAELCWKILNIEEAYEVRQEDFDEGSEGLVYYEQALIDKAVYVIYTYPRDK